MYLLGYPNFFQMVHDLQQEIKKRFTKNLPDMTGMNVMESLQTP